LTGHFDLDLNGLLAEQIAYYRTRAEEYDSTYPLDVHADSAARAELLTTLEGLAPFGATLELACGTGQWTAELARHASRVTAVDAAPEALAICRRRVPANHVQLVEADLFTWRPRERYDFVFFSGWLSHVPPQRFDAFWAVVADCVKPGGRVFVIDELPAMAATERTADEQPAPAVRRETAESFVPSRCSTPPTSYGQDSMPSAGRPTSERWAGGSSAPRFITRRPRSGPMARPWVSCTGPAARNVRNAVRPHRVAKG
jgi:SAM-dependent methyltransferase